MENEEKIKGQWREKISKKIVNFEYQNCNNFDILPYEKCSQVICFAFNENGELLLVHDKDKKSWGPSGRGIEKPESFEETAKRELKEEVNMKVLQYKPIGFQKVWKENEEEKNTEIQLRVFCLVKPYGEFKKDPDGDVDKIMFINPKEYKKYFHWGKPGDMILKKV